MQTPWRMSRVARSSAVGKPQLNHQTAGARSEVNPGEQSLKDGQMYIVYNINQAQILDLHL